MLRIWLLLILFFPLFAYPQPVSSPPLELKDEGVSQGRPVFSIDCEGYGISCSRSGTTGTVAISLDTVSGDNRYLKLDQSSAQTLTASPILNWLTTSELTATDANKKLQSLAVATYPSLTETSYIKGTTSAIQTQLNNKQALDADLTAIAALGFTSTAFLKKTAADTWALDTATYEPSFTKYNLAGTTNQVSLSASGTGALLARDITLSLPQDIHTGASPTFVTVKLSNLTDGYVPYHVADATGLANSPIFTDATNVGIGTATPNISSRTKALTISTPGVNSDGASGLELKGSAGYNTEIGAVDYFETWSSVNHNIARVAGLVGAAAVGSGQLAFYTKANGLSIAERMRITEAGYVGIGNTAPDSTLSVGTNRVSVLPTEHQAIINTNFGGANGTGGRDTLILSNGGTDPTTTILGSALAFKSPVYGSTGSWSSGRILSYFDNSGGSNPGYAGGILALQYPTADNVFATGLVLRNGITGIGTTAPATYSKVTIEQDNNGGQQLIIRGTTSPNKELGVGYDTNGDFGSIYAFEQSGAAKPLVLQQYGGNVGIGTSSFVANCGVLTITNGITFPATQSASSNANTLDDYEEGTWTPGLSFGGGTTGITYASQGGSYVKIGKLVTVVGYVGLSSNGSSSGDAAITGLPFTIASGAQNYSAASLRLSQVSFANQYMGYGVVNTTTIGLEELTEAGTRTTLTEGNFADNAEVMVSFNYFVT